MKQKSASILLIIPNLSHGGAQNVFRQHYEHLSTIYKLHACVFNWDGTSREEWPSSIISLDVPAGNGLIQKVIFFVKRVVKLRRLKRELTINVSISHLEGADYVNVLSMVNDKAIFWIHGTKKHDGNIEGHLGILRRKILIPFLYKKAYKIVTVSKGIADELAKDYPSLKSKLLTIYNGFDVEKIVAKSNESIEDEFSIVFQQSKIIITHCRLARQKNLKALLHIFNNCSNADRVKLVIVGDGELREELLSFCKCIGTNYWAIWENELVNTDADVYFIGQQDNPFKFLRHSSIYVMTSDWEGFPLALCEAMVCGLPVMAADCFTGPREIIAPEMSLSQPLKFPYSNNFGVIMPLASNPDALQVWVNEMDKFISEVHSRPRDITIGINRIRDFDLSKSIRQTFNLLRLIPR